MQRTFWILIPLLLLGATAWLVSSPGEGPSALPPVSQGATEGRSPDAEVLSTAAVESGRTEAARLGDGSKLDFELHGAGSLASKTWTGTVFDEATLRPIEAAAVTVTDETYGSEATTDEEGFFEVQWPEKRPARLAIAHPNYVDRVRTLADGEEVYLTASGSIHGRLAPEPGATLSGRVAHLMPLWGDRPLEEKRLEAEASSGEFRFHDLDPGRYLLEVLGDGCPAIEPMVVVASGEVTELVVPIRRGEELRVNVVGKHTGPINGAQARWTPVDPWLKGKYDREPSEWQWTPAPAALVFSHVPPTQVLIEVTLPWGGVQTHVHTVVADDVPDEVTLRVDEAASLSGTVLDGEGKPVPGALIVGTGPGAEDFPWTTPNADVESRYLAVGAFYLQADARGEFSSDAVPVGRLRLAAYPPGADDSFCVRVQRVTTVTSKPTRVSLSLAQTEAVFGRVVDDQGRGIAGAEVVLRSKENGTIEQGRVVTSSSGTYGFNHAPVGDVHVRANLDGFQMDIPAWLQLTAGRPLEVDDLVLLPTSVVRGRIIDPNGWSIPGARVTFTAAEQRSQTFTADELGTFEAQLREGIYGVRVKANGYAMAKDAVETIAVPTQGEWVFSMESREPATPGTIVGEVVLAGTQGPVPGLTIRGRKGRIVIEGTRFRAMGLTPGRVKLGAGAPGFESVIFDPVQVNPGSTVDVGRFTIRSLARVEVTVTDASTGKVIPGARVELRRVADNYAHEISPGVVIPKKVKLEFERKGGHYQARAGRYAWRLIVSAKGYKTSSEEVRVTTGAEFQVALAKSKKKNKK